MAAKWPCTIRHGRRSLCRSAGILPRARQDDHSACAGQSVCCPLRGRHDRLRMPALQKTSRIVQSHLAVLKTSEPSKCAEFWPPRIRSDHEWEIRISSRLRILKALGHNLLANSSANLLGRGLNYVENLIANSVERQVRGVRRSSRLSSRSKFGIDGVRDSVLDEVGNIHFGEFVGGSLLRADGSARSLAVPGEPYSGRR